MASNGKRTVIKASGGQILPGRRPDPKPSATCGPPCKGAAHPAAGICKHALLVIPGVIVHVSEQTGVCFQPPCG